MKTRFPRSGRLKLIGLFAALALFPITVVTVVAGEQGSVGPKFTPKLKDLIIQEMQLVLQASSQIHVAIVTGDHETVATQAIKIHNSFIMKRSLTEQDKKDLMKAVPPAFIALDAKLHETAAKLAHAAKQKDVELEAVFFAKMTESCVSCHTSYASDRFPSLSTTTARPH